MCIHAGMVSDKRKLYTDIIKSLKEDIADLQKEIPFLEGLWKRHFDDHDLRRITRESILLIKDQIKDLKARIEEYEQKKRV